MRILIVSLYYPPLNTIAAHRIAAFARYLPQYGIDVDVITRYYDPEQQKGKSMFLGGQAPKNFSEVYRRSGNVIYTGFSESNPLLSVSGRMPPVLRGLYNYRQVDVWHYDFFTSAINAYRKEFAGNKYDLIISSYGPPIAIRLAAGLSELTGVPYLVDFRDSFIDERDKGIHLLMKKWVLKRHLSDAAGLIFATAGMKDYFARTAPEQLTRIPSAVVYNGVDENVLPVPAAADSSIVQQYHDLKKNYDLLLLHTGTVYEGQDIGFFIRGIKKFNEGSPKELGLIFLGAAENKSSIPHDKDVHFLGKTAHATSLWMQRDCGALLLPVWAGRYTGFSGKTLEYLQSGNFVICSPSPQNDLLEFLQRSGNAFVAADETGLQTLLGDIVSGKLRRVEASAEDKAVLGRAHWVKVLADYLKKLKND